MCKTKLLSSYSIPKSQNPNFTRALKRSQNSTSKMSLRSTTILSIIFFIFLSTASVISESLSTDGIDDVCKTSDSGDEIQTTSSSCNIRCFRADPVCGVNGVTYWCGCPEAACKGVRVVKRGHCEVGNGGSSGQALLLVHIVWMIVVGILVVFGFFWFE